MPYLSFHDQFEMAGRLLKKKKKVSLTPHPAIIVTIY